MVPWVHYLNVGMITVHLKVKQVRSSLKLKKAKKNLLFLLFKKKKKVHSISSLVV